MERKILMLCVERVESLPHKPYMATDGVCHGYGMTLEMAISAYEANLGVWRKLAPELLKRDDDMTLNMQKKRKNGEVVSRGIEWTDATWNPIAGCPHQCRWTMPDGKTAICYAESIADGIASSAYPHGFAHHYWKPQHLDAPGKKKKSLKIFCGSMSDVFAKEVPTEHIQAVLDVIRSTPQHIYQLLTKNPIRTKNFDMPDNVWLGASMPPDFMRGNKLNANQKQKMLEVTLKSLTAANARVKWMSFEPLSWDVSALVAEHGECLDWAVIGAASSGRNYYPPSASDFQSLVTILDGFGTAIFYKGNLKSLDAARAAWREEFPKPKTVSNVKSASHLRLLPVPKPMLMLPAPKVIALLPAPKPKPMAYHVAWTARGHSAAAYRVVSDDGDIIKLEIGSKGASKVLAFKADDSKLKAA